MRIVFLLFGSFLIAIPFSLAQIIYPQSPTAIAYPQWSHADSVLILDKDSSAPMRVFIVTNETDSILLRKQSLAVNPDSNDAVLTHFIERLYQTVTDSASLGVGIAAPQVGLLRNIIWVQRFDKEGFPFEVYLNPEIVQYSKTERCGPEGCLSIPDKRDSVFRSQTIMISYDRLDGAHVIEMVDDFTGVIFQHEIDHLNGLLYIDHVAADRKKTPKLPERK